MKNLSYVAELDQPADDAPCVCNGCTWAGVFAQLEPIETAILTPGHPSPAGRCPDCDSLAYPKEAPAQAGVLP